VQTEARVICAAPETGIIVGTELGISESSPAGVLGEGASVEEEGTIEGMSLSLASPAGLGEVVGTNVGASDPTGVGTAVNGEGAVEGGIVGGSEGARVDEVGAGVFVPIPISCASET